MNPFASTNTTTLPLPPTTAFTATSQASSSQPPTMYQSKMKKLNETFTEWMSKQNVANPTSLWNDGMQVYNYNYNYTYYIYLMI